VFNGADARLQIPRQDIMANATISTKFEIGSGFPRGRMRKHFLAGLP